MRDREPRVAGKTRSCHSTPKTVLLLKIDLYLFMAPSRIVCPHTEYHFKVNKWFPVTFCFSFSADDGHCIRATDFFSGTQAQKSTAKAAKAAATATTQHNVSIVNNNNGARVPGTRHHTLLFRAFELEEDRTESIKVTTEPNNKKEKL